MKSYVIFGCGRFGSTLAKELYRLGNEVFIIDEDEDKIEAISDQVTTAVVADILEEGIFEELGLSNFDAAIVAIGSHLESSIVAILACIEAGIGLIIAKAPSRKYGRILEKIGAHQVVYPESDMAQRLAKRLTSEKITNSFMLSEDYSLVERRVPKGWIGSSLSQIDVRNKYHINVLAIRRGADLKVKALDDVNFQEGDAIIFLGQAQDIETIEKKEGKA
ncbi:MAG: TrkA family potassium uptake protein [Tissierellia bacterium]|nr:TrkA family potassium uptake protein [Tissierellia bacterium]